MYLKIENPDGLDLSDFLNFLIEEIKKVAINPKNYDGDLAKLWGEYFANTDLGWPKDQLNQPVAPSFRYIINEFFSNLKVLKAEGSYTICVDNTLLLGLSSVTIVNIASIINYGTLTLKAYPYFDMVFDLFAENLPQIYSTWRALNVGRTL